VTLKLREERGHVAGLRARLECETDKLLDLEGDIPLAEEAYDAQKLLSDATVIGHDDYECVHTMCDALWAAVQGLYLDEKAVKARHALLTNQLKLHESMVGGLEQSRARLRSGVRAMRHELGL
jgi:hypothetical protein